LIFRARSRSLPAGCWASSTKPRSACGKACRVTLHEGPSSISPAPRSLDGVQGAVVGGFAAPAPVTETLWSYVGEQRSFTLLALTEADLPAPLPAATDADLLAYYTTNIAAYTRAEAKRISYAALLPDALAPDQTIPDADLQAAYDERIAEYVIPERRLVERLVYPDAAAAAAAKARIDAGEPFEALVSDRGLSLTDIDLGDVTQADLGTAGDAVFALAGPGVVGPFDTDLGPALFRMNAILAAQNTTFDQARPALLAELQGKAARRSISDRVEAIDDALAGGATLEDLVRDEGMALGVTDYVTGDPENDAITAYRAFAAAADVLAPGDFPEAILLDDGGVIALRLDATIPPAPIPLAPDHEQARGHGDETDHQHRQTPVDLAARQPVLGRPDQQRQDQRRPHHPGECGERYRGPGAPPDHRCLSRQVGGGVEAGHLPGLSASAPACRRNSHRSPVRTCAPASRPRRTSRAVDTAGIWNPPGPHKGHS
jgi:hypothetical protein